MQDWCLVTDIDGTLIGETETSVHFRRVVLDARAQLAERGVRLRWVIATGRDLASCDEVLLDQGFDLSDFDARATSVGADVFIGSNKEPDAEYHSRLASTGFDGQQVHAALGRLSFLRRQPFFEQRVHKISYHCPSVHSYQDQVLEALSSLAFETLTVFSHDDYLDVAPVNGAKRGAVAYLAERWGIPPARVVVAGDSGNDRSMLDSDWQGIVVGNAYAELADLRKHPRIYFATRNHAAGILEGLQYYGFI
jgi:sucrose-phosphate synthase